MFNKFANFITSWRFAAFIISLCVSMTLIFLGILLIPNATTGIGAFAVDFKTWCFGYDPATGGFEWGYVIIMLINPLILAGFVYMLWSRPLHQAMKASLMAVLGTVGVGLLAAVLLGGGMFALGPDEVSAEQLPFPAERIRTELDPPSFELTDQNGEKVALEDLRGRVVLLTAIYASCHTACPMIMVQARKATNALPDDMRDDVTIVAITLDPENDTPERLKEAAAAHQVEAPLWRLVTGEPDTVNEILDDLSVSRRKNPETGEIDHSNLFALIDRDGKIAYRLTLGDRHDTWLPTALKVLVEEGREKS
ncbi:MAG: SCO family protein [Persicimonas sp.]